MSLSSASGWAANILCQCKPDDNKDCDGHEQKLSLPFPATHTYFKRTSCSELLSSYCCNYLYFLSGSVQKQVSTGKPQQ